MIPLDDRRQWYRFHHLMAEFLQSELARQDPARRARRPPAGSDWCHAHGDAEGAVRHAVLSGDLDRAEALVLHWFGRVAGAGRVRRRSTGGWRCSRPTTSCARPGLMVAAAHGSLPGR